MPFLFHFQGLIFNQIKLYFRLLGRIPGFQSTIPGFHCVIPVFQGEIPVFHGAIPVFHGEIPVFQKCSIFGPT